MLVNAVENSGHNIQDIYIDDGYTGTNFDRPGFKRMIENIEKGLIDMVITKDSSRLGRDYIEVGHYYEKYFPSKGVRCIALADGFDTAIDSSNNDMLPIKAVFNDMYSKDNSKKIRAALRSKQKEGKWVGGCPPMGYIQDRENKNKLVVNEQEDYIVRKIFELAVNGYSMNKIKNYLIDNKYPTRAMLKNGIDYRTANATDSKLGLWAIKTIKGILTNRLYTGDMVQNRRQKLNYKVKKIVNVPESQWVIVEDTHEALVSKSDFKKIQELLPKTQRRNDKKNIRLLDGLLKCYECGHSITISNPRKVDSYRTYMTCNYYRKHSKHKVCTPHAFNYDKFEEVVLTQVREVILNYLNKIELDSVASKVKIQNTKTVYKTRLESVKFKYESSVNKLDKMYLDKLEGKVTDDMYERVYTKLNEDQKKLKLEIDEIEALLYNHHKSSKKEFDLNKFLEDFISLKTVTREMVLKLIDKIYVHQDKKIDIYYSFNHLN